MFWLWKGVMNVIRNKLDLTVSSIAVIVFSNPINCSEFYDADDILIFCSKFNFNFPFCYSHVIWSLALKRSSSPELKNLRKKKLIVLTYQTIVMYKY